MAKKSFTIYVMSSGDPHDQDGISSEMAGHVFAGALHIWKLIQCPIDYIAHIGDLQSKQVALIAAAALQHDLEDSPLEELEGLARKVDMTVPGDYPTVASAVADSSVVFNDRETVLNALFDVVSDMDIQDERICFIAGQPRWIELAANSEDVPYGIPAGTVIEYTYVLDDEEPDSDLVLDPRSSRVLYSPTPMSLSQSVQ
jgi:hypothetical protein